MSVLMKKPPIEIEEQAQPQAIMEDDIPQASDCANNHPRVKEFITFSIRGPIKHKAKIMAYLRKHGYVDTAESIPREEFFTDPGSPGKSLAAYRYREDLTQAQLAQMIGVPQHHISEMENNKRPIGKKMARRLAEALNINYRMLL